MHVMLKLPITRRNITDHVFSYFKLSINIPINHKKRVLLGTLYHKCGETYSNHKPTNVSSK